MSIRNQRTRRHEDDFPAKLHQGTATVGDLIEHAQEIIVETPEAFGTATSDTVRLLLQLIDKMSSAEYDADDIHQNDKLSEVLEG